MLMKPFILLGLLHVLVQSASEDYRLEKVIEFGQQEQIVEIVAVNETTFAVRTQDEVTLFQGPDFQPKEQTIKVPKGTSKLTKHGLVNLEESGAFLQFQKFDQNITMMEDNLQMSMLITPKYALFNKDAFPYPTVVRLDLTTFQKKTITYFEVLRPFLFYTAILSDLQNGDILYMGRNFDLIFLDYETLELKTTLKYNMAYFSQYASVYNDEKTNKSTILIQKHAGNELKRDESGKYSLEERYNGFLFNDVILTGLDTGVTIQNCEIQYLSNFKSIVRVSYDLKDYLEGRKGIALSNDETFFAARNDSGYYEFYRIGEDFSVKSFQSVFVSSLELRKGKLTSDDKNLLVAVTDKRDKNNIAKIDIKEGKFLLITDQFGNSDNQHDFALFHARYNRLVTMEFRGTSYYLQLRQLDSLDLLDEYQLKFDFQIAEYKLISDNDWNLTFGLALRIAPYAYDLEKDTKLFMFKVESDKIVSLNISTNVSFNTLESCTKYVLNFKQRFPPIKFFHISNLSLAFTIESQIFADIIFQKHIMIISDDNMYTVLDLSNAPDIKTIGWVKINWYNSQIRFVMVNRGVLFIAPNINKTDAPISFTNKFFNISSPLIKSRVSLNKTTIYGCPSAVYYIPPKKTSPQCNFVFYIEYEQPGYEEEYLPQIVKYSQCGRTYEKYKIVEYEVYVKSRIFISSDKKYVIVIVNPVNVDELLLQIRAIDAMERIIFHKVFKTRAPYPYMDHYNVDIIRDNIIIFHTSDFITVYFIEPKEFAEDHQMSKISHFDVNDRKIVALTGPTLRDSSMTRVVVKEIASKINMFEAEVDSEASIVALSPLQERVAVYSEDSTLRVWSVPSKSIILSVAIEKTTKIKFEDENSIAVDTEEGKRRISFTKQGKYEISGLVADEKAKLKVNNGLIAADAANKIGVWTQRKRQASLNAQKDEIELLQE